MKSPRRAISEILQDIYSLDDQISSWWKGLRSSFELRPAIIAETPPSIFPNLLLIHIVYHQCLCALHASIVPLFCLDNATENWTSARQISAQVAYEHACKASALISATISSSHKVSSIPSFVAYAAYCGCAIQIPFIFSSDQAIGTLARNNVTTNFKIIEALARYWRFAAILVKEPRSFPSSKCEADEWSTD